jgi:hypothetical protein
VVKKKEKKCGGGGVQHITVVTKKRKIMPREIYIYKVVQVLSNGMSKME